MGAKKPEHRKRYVAFILTDDPDAQKEPIPCASPPERGEFIRALRRAWKAGGGIPEDPASPYLTAYEGGRGIVRCGHLHRDDTLKILAGLDLPGPPGSPSGVSVRTVLTSGTIRKAKLRLSISPKRRARHR